MNKKKVDYEVVGQRIGQIRKIRGLTQRELAERIGVDPSHVSNLEHGRATLTMEKLMLLCGVLECGFDDIFFNEYVFRDESLQEEWEVENQLLKMLQRMNLRKKKAVLRFLSSMDVTDF